MGSETGKLKIEVPPSSGSCTGSGFCTASHSLPTVQPRVSVFAPNGCSRKLSKAQYWSVSIAESH